MKRIFAFALFAIVPALAQAQSNIRLEGGLGFSADPDAFLLNIEAPYFFTDEFSIGPAVQLILEDDFTIVAPSIDARYTFDLSSTTTSSVVRRFKPFVLGGVGFIHADRDDPPSFRDEDDIEFLIHLGLGTHYRITPHIGVGTKFNFNIMPDDLFNENFIFSWEVARVQFSF